MKSGRRIRIPSSCPQLLKTSCRGNDVDELALVSGGVLRVDVDDEAMQPYGRSVPLEDSLATSSSFALLGGWWDMIRG